MEIVVSYFWFIKLVFALAIIYSAYKAINLKVLFKQKKYNPSKFWYVVFMILSLLWVFNPIRLDININKVQSQTNTTIKNNKLVPPKLEDNSFNSKVVKSKGITEKDLL